MNLMKKLMTALRGGAREAGESLVDANSIRIFEQEIKDAEADIQGAKTGLTEVMAQEMQVKRQLDSLEHSMRENEDFVAQALEKGNEDLALELAEKVAGIENQIDEQSSIRTTLITQIDGLKKNIKNAEKTIKENQRQLSMVKATESVQKATMAVQDSLISQQSAFSSGKESLERIKKRQQLKADQMEAALELDKETGDQGLKDRMAEAGIGSEKSKASDVLLRIKQRQAKSDQT